MTCKTLVIHPVDRSTDFLRPIYENIHATVVSGGVTRHDLRRLVVEASRVLLLGHGGPPGLLSVGQFPEPGPLVIDESFAPLLRGSENLMVFCFASAFGHACRIPGLASGMFISEMSESEIFLDVTVTEAEIAESNQAFSQIVSRHALAPLSILHEAVKEEYGRIARVNVVASHNLSQFELLEAHRLSDSVGPSEQRSRSDTQHGATRLDRAVRNV